MGFVVIFYNLFNSNFISPMIFTIPGISTSHLLFRPLNIIYQIIFYFTIVECAIISDVVVLITISYVQGDFLAIIEFISRLDEDIDDKNQPRSILKILHETHKGLQQSIRILTQIYWHFYFHKLFTITLYFGGILILVQSLSEKLPLAIMVTSAMIVQLFILCFFGQILKNSSEQLSEALYLNKWYDMPIKDQKNLLILMTNLQKIVQIETFAFGDISIYTFVQVTFL